MINRAYAIIFILISSASTVAGACKDDCASLRKQARQARKSMRTCLMNSAPCETERAAIVARVQAIRACLPGAPLDAMTDSGMVALTQTGSKRGKCDDEKKAYADSGAEIFGCLLVWDNAAGQRYRFELPKDDCSAALPAFIAARDRVKSCIAQKQPGERWSFGSSY